MTDLTKDLLDLMDIETIEVNLFRGESPEDSWQRVFGGQVLGQALVAASRTVEDRPCHSLHAYFLRPGDPKVPIVYDVDRIRDGRSFTTRRVVAIQHGRPIFNMSASFHIHETGPSHQFDMPNVPPPEDLRSEFDLRSEVLDQIPETFRKWFGRKRPIEVRPVNPGDLLNPQKGPPFQDMWMRVTAPLPDDPKLHQCLVAFASDMTLLGSTLSPHGLSWLSGKVQMASLDHAMWFHRPFRADQWLLYAQDSPSSEAARGFARGSIYTRDGTLVASVAQEGMVRITD